MLKFYFTVLRFFKKKKYNRHVSLGDLIFDRHNTAKFYNFGEGTTCYNNVLILGDVKIGKNCWIGPNVILDGSGGLSIGDNCQICAGVQIYSHNSINRDAIRYQKTVIGNNVYVGPNSIVQMGVGIGHNVVVGALSFVNKNVSENHKCWGIPVVKQ